MEFILGAYASAPSLNSVNKRSEIIFYELLKKKVENIKGLEIPFYGEAIHPLGNNFLINMLEDRWSNVITAVPASFTLLKENIHFGLASNDQQARKFALSCHKRLNSIIHEINDKKGNLSVSHVHLCSSPSFPNKNVESSADSLRISLEEIMLWNWDGAEITIEHCDSHDADGIFQKGFLPIEQELKVLGDMNYPNTGVVLNWGRSVLEGKSTKTILDHIELCQDRGLLKGLIFSGTSENDLHYGAWSDQHMPFRILDSNIDKYTNSLLDEEAIKQARNIIELDKLSYVGFKIQPLPQGEATIEKRVQINIDAERALQRYFN